MSDFGVIGLGVMGENLARNIEDHGFSVAVWNLETEWTDRFIASADGRKFTGAKTLEELVAAIERPRRILMMIKAGDPIDQMIERLLPILDAGDILIDGGNSWFRDTQRRTERVTPTGIHFVGCGVSGGEEGARFGPSLMPGGTQESWESLRPVFEAIAAKTDSGPCVTHVGSDGAGHFVKMVHNGIEYGDMQLIAEAYEILRVAGGMQAAELAGVFAKWNEGPLESFLVEITADILRVVDEGTGKPLVDLVLDRAGQKGTGKWTAQVALDLGVSVPTIAAAIDARVISSMRDERLAASACLYPPQGPQTLPSREALVQDVHDALLAGRVCAYAQGMRLIRDGGAEYGWQIDLREIARIWKGGCIIRARMLDDIMNAYERHPRLTSLVLDRSFAGVLERSQDGWRKAVGLAQSMGIAVPALGASLAWYDAMRSARLPQNLTQAQRDYFGAHRYERVDNPGESVHTNWKALLKDQ